MKLSAGASVLATLLAAASVSAAGKNGRGNLRSGSSSSKNSSSSTTVPKSRGLAQIDAAARWSRQMMMKMGGSADEILLEMVLAGDLSQDQYGVIADQYLKGMLSQMNMSDLGHTFNIESEEAADTLASSRADLLSYVQGEASAGSHDRGGQRPHQRLQRQRSRQPTGPDGSGGRRRTPV